MLFALLDTGSAAAFVIGMCVTLAIVGMAYGPCGALLPKVFHTRYRRTGAGLGYNLAGVLGVVSFLCTRALVETKDRAL